MTILVPAGMFIVAVIMLWKGAEWVVESAAAIALKLGVSELVIGLTVIALGTSAPEFVVTIGAALKGHNDLSVANIVGSNIFNLGFILGGVALVHPLVTTPKLVLRDGVVLALAALFIVFSLRDLRLTRLEGLTLFAGLIAYIIFLYAHKEKVETPTDLHPPGWHDYLMLPGGLLVLIVGGHILVESATHLARSFGLSEWVIGVTIVAAGTSAPEFFTSLVAAFKGRHEISAGNLIGSDLFNLMGVLGLAGIIRPLAVSPESLISTGVMLGMILIVIIMMRTGWCLSRPEGALLVVVNAIRWVLDFLHIF